MQIELEGALAAMIGLAQSEQSRLAAAGLVNLFL